MATVTQPAIDFIHRHGASRVTLVGACDPTPFADVVAGWAHRSYR
jgi:hypothetical protein